MKRVLFVFGGNPEDASNRYRCRNLCERLAEAGWQPEWASTDQVAVTVNHDLVVVHRLPFSAAEPWISAAKKIGAGLLYSADDLVFEREFSVHKGILHPDDPLHLRAAQRSVEGMRATIEQMDGVVVSTEYLAREAAAFGKPTVVIRNLPSIELLERSELARTLRAARRATRSDDRLLLGYLSGSATHDSDLAEFAEPLAEVLEKQTNMRLLVVGEVRLPGVLERLTATGRIQRHPFVSWQELPGVLSSIDVNLAPLDLTRPFCHGKSEVKWLEAAAVDVPTLASAAAGLSESLTDGEELLLAGTTESVRRNLERLIQDAGLRDALANRAFSALANRVLESAAETDRVLSPFLRSARGTETVRIPLRARFAQRLWAWEEAQFRRANYLRRHFREIHRRTRHGL